MWFGTMQEESAKVSVRLKEVLCICIQTDDTCSVAYLWKKGIMQHLGQWLKETRHALWIKVVEGLGTI